MKERLEKFIKTEGLTPSRFAEIMGVQPSSISHILGGRNKPSYDFIEKMLLRFPKINPDWLILGKGQIYRQLSENPIITTQLTQNLFELPTEGINLTQNQEKTQEDNTPIINNPISTVSKNTFKTNESSSVIQITGDIEQIVVFYKDKTFTSYHPK